MPGTIRIAVAAASDIERIERLRHDVYATQLAQRPENPEGRLSSPVDAHATFVMASRDGELMGFVGVTPPSAPQYSFEAYVTREALGVTCDAGLFELRLLTVADAHRGTGEIAALLLFGAFRWIQGHGGERIVAISLVELSGLYQKLGLTPLGHRVQLGAKEGELMTGDLEAIRARAAIRPAVLRMLERIDWQLGVPMMR